MQPGASLAVSVVARPFPAEGSILSRFAAWAALAMADALALWGVDDVQIKWPNDLLLDGYKIGGILVEILWHGSVPRAAVIGVGVNLRPEALPPGMPLDFPAGSLLALRQVTVEPADLAAAFWRAWVQRRHDLASAAFVQAWDARLAFRGAWVEVTTASTTLHGRVVGLTPAGGLRLQTPEGPKTIWQAERLRPLQDIA